MTNYTATPVATRALDSDAAYGCAHTSSLATATTAIP